MKLWKLSQNGCVSTHVWSGKKKMYVDNVRLHVLFIAEELQKYGKSQKKTSVMH